MSALWSPFATCFSAFSLFRYSETPLLVNTNTRISWKLRAVGDVSLPSAGRFTPIAAKSKFERSWSESILSLNSVPEALSQSASITGLPPVFAGAGSFWNCAMASVLQMSVAISVSAKRFFMGYSLRWVVERKVE